MEKNLFLQVPHHFLEYFLRKVPENWIQNEVVHISNIFGLVQVEVHKRVRVVINLIVFRSLVITRI